MGANSAIEWTDHTFNPWWGCEKISPACAYCYAEAGSDRRGFDVWGRQAPRRFFSDKHWEEPRKWNRQAAKAGKPAFVFCASYGDVCELLPTQHSAHERMQDERDRLAQLIRETQWLTWLLLTKRPENFGLLFDPFAPWPDNAWAGTTAENQECLGRRWPDLMQVPARRRFLSCEPLLGPLDLQQTFDRWINSIPGTTTATWPGLSDYLHWVICGGESDPTHGKNARPMRTDWATGLRDECVAAGIPFFFKQWGDWRPQHHLDPQRILDYRIDSQGRDVTELLGLWDESDEVMVQIGKKKAGRLLDGREWNDRPVGRLPA